MRSHKAVAHRYAEAVANIMEDGGSYQAVDEELQRFLAVLRQHPGMKNVIEDPSLSRGDKTKFMQEVAGLLELGETVVGLLVLLIQKERFRALEEIAKSYREIYKERLGLLEVEVRSVFPLNEEQLERVRRLVNRMTGKTAEVRQVEDRSLLGGLVVRMGNTILDTSIKNHLGRIKRSLTARRIDGESTV